MKKKEGKKSTLHWHTVSQQHEKTLLINYLAWGLRKSVEIPIFERVQHCLRRRVVSSSCEDMFSSTSLSPLLVFLSHFLRILEKKNDARIQPIIFFFFFYYYARSRDRSFLFLLRSFLSLHLSDLFVVTFIYNCVYVYIFFFFFSFSPCSFFLSLSLSRFPFLIGPLHNGTF